MEGRGCWRSRRGGEEGKRRKKECGYETLIPWQILQSCKIEAYVHPYLSKYTYRESWLRLVWWFIHLARTSSLTLPSSSTSPSSCLCSRFLLGRSLRKEQKYIHSAFKHYTHSHMTCLSSQPISFLKVSKRRSSLTNIGLLWIRISLCAMAS